MKALIVVIALGLAVGQMQAQKLKENEVPQIVKTAFAKAYPTAKAVKWDKEDGSYEATFDQNKKDMSVVLDAQGVIKEVETTILKSDLPKAVQSTLAKDYAGYKIEEAATIMSNGVVTFEAEVEKGEKSFDLIFDKEGKLLKKIEKAGEAKD